MNSSTPVQKNSNPPACVTILTAYDRSGQKPRTVGKTFMIEADGSVSKTADTAVAAFKARTVEAPTPQALAAILGGLTSEQALILGHAKNQAGGADYWLLSASAMDNPPPGARHVQLKKENFEPGRWMLLDRDDDIESPFNEQLAEYDAWFGTVCSLHPDLAGAARVICPSASSRVVFAAGRPVTATPGHHTYILVRDGGAVEPYGHTLNINAWVRGWGYLRSNKSGGTLQRTIFDPSTFTPSRRVFESAPVAGPGLQVLPANITAIDGVAIALPTAPTADFIAKYHDMTRRKVDVSGNGARVLAVRAYDLDLDMPIDTADGVMTPQDFLDSGENKLRCQTPFRGESTSMAAFLRRDGDQVKLHDCGDNVTHHPPVFQPIQQPGDLVLEAQAVPAAPDTSGPGFASVTPGDPVVPTVEGLMADFEVSEEEAAGYDDAEFIYPDLVVKGHLAVFPAPPNAGKTTIFFNYVAPKLVEAGMSVYYVNADVGQSDAKVLVSDAKKGGFCLLLPDMKIGQSMGTVVDRLAQLNSVEGDYRNTVFIFDTLKKMTEVINKARAKDLYKLLRSLTAKGMTIILLAHTNKYTDVDGMPVYEGTGDLRADVDEMIYLIPKKNSDGSLTVSTHPDKTRAKCKPITFHIGVDRTVTQEGYVDVLAAKQAEGQRAKDGLAIEAITECLRNTETATQSDVVRWCKGSSLGISRRTVLAVLKRYEHGPEVLWHSQQLKDQKNAKAYAPAGMPFAPVGSAPAPPPLVTPVPGAPK